MGLPDWFSTTDILRVIEVEVADPGGRVTDVFDDGDRLFARALLPEERQVRRGDRLQGGVALMVAGNEVRVCPYVFRQVCSNGAIMPRSGFARRIELPECSADG